MMKRFLLLVGMTAACQTVWSPTAQAHWRFGCRSYYGGSYYSYSPRWCHPSYSACSPYYSSYGSYCGTGYSPYLGYDVSPQYNYFGPGYSSGLGNNLLGSLGAYGLFGGNLGGSLVQPSYLSMPVGVGYGQSGYLQIPVGNPPGRASYLQVPVSTGYGPPSYLQIELGRNPGTGSDAPVPAPTPKPLGAIPGDGLPTANLSARSIHKTSADDVPSAVPRREGDPTYEFAVDDAEVGSADSRAAGGKRTSGKTTSSAVKFQLVSWLKVPVALPASHEESATRRGNEKDTSFSLVDDEVKGPALPQPEPKSPDKAPKLADRDGTPWIAN
jgi:hypothetical protein